MVKTKDILKTKFKREVKELNADANYILCEINKYVKNVYEFGIRVGTAEAELKKGCCKDGKKKDCKCKYKSKGE